MSQNLDKKALDKNFKLMAISAVVLLILFVYTLYKGGSHIEGGSYYIGIGFLFVLLFVAFIVKLKQDKLKEYFDKNKKKSAFGKQLDKAKANVTNEDLNTNIHAVNSNVTFKDIAGISEIKEELEEVVDFLNEPNKYLKYGVKLPKGVLR